MKIYPRWIKISLLFAMGTAILGCSRDKSAQSQQEVVIAPDQFVLDEPSKIIAHGDIKKSKKCRLDSVNGKVRSEQGDWQIKHGDPVIFGGWAFNEDGAGVTPEVFFSLTGGAQTYFAVTTTRHARNDVNDYFHISPALEVGFQLQAKTDGMEPGAYEIMILLRNGTTVEGCDTKTLLLVD